MVIRDFEKRDNSVYLESINILNGPTVKNNKSNNTDDKNNFSYSLSMVIR